MEAGPFTVKTRHLKDGREYYSMVQGPIRLPKLLLDRPGCEQLSKALNAAYRKGYWDALKNERTI